MNIPKCGLELIEREEGLRLAPYQDVAGIWTYGIGNIRDLDGRPVTKDTQPLHGEEQAQLLLARDAGKSWRAVLALVLVILSETQAGALLSFTYNLGSGALQVAALRRSILAGRQPTEDEWTRWCKAGRPLRKSEGLYRRRLHERALFDR